MIQIAVNCNRLKNPIDLNMVSKTRLSSHCSKRGDNAVNLVTSLKTDVRLARPMNIKGLMTYLLT